VKPLIRLLVMQPITERNQ